MEGLFWAHGLKPLGSVSLETHKKSVWPTGCACKRDQDGWADGRMGGLAKISGGTLHKIQGARLEPFGQHAFRGA